MRNDTLRDKAKYTNGRVIEDNWGISELRDDSGGLLGFYDSVLNETRDSSGVLLGNGNMFLGCAKTANYCNQ